MERPVISFFSYIVNLIPRLVLEGVSEAGPTTSSLEFGLGGEEGDLAAKAGVGSLLVIVIYPRAGKWPLSALLSCHVVLQTLLLLYEI